MTAGENPPTDEYSRFVPDALNYQIVPLSADKAFYQQQISERLQNGEYPQLPNKKSNKKDNVTLKGVLWAEDATSRKAILHQIMATCSVLLLAAACGLPIGYSAVLLPQITSAAPDNTTGGDNFAIDIEMGSWIASVHSLATPVGSFLSGPLADYIGRRKTLLVSVAPMFIGWTLLATAQSFPWLIAGRFICGFAVGILGGPGQVYIAETTEPNLRGLLIGAPFFSYSLGILIVYALGSLLHWRAVAWCGYILPALAALSMLCVPESPAWLLRQGRVAQAQKALGFLRCNEIKAQKELNEMTERLERERVNTASSGNENIFKLCCQRVAIKPLVIVIVLCFLQMFSGTFIVVFYAIDIIAEFGSEFDTQMAAIWTAVVRMLCSIIFCVLLLFVRRRRILIISGVGSGLSCLVLSIYMYAHVNTPKTGADIIMAASCLLTYIAFNTALMIMPGIMIGELFPAKIRGRTAGTVFAAMNVSLFGFAKAFPVIQAALKMRGVFMIFAISSFMVSLFMFMFQPETKGRSLEQIEDYFNEDHWLWFKRDKSYKVVPQQLAHEAKV